MLGVSVAKPTISMDPDLYAAAKAAAERAGVSFSAWIEDAAGHKLRKERLLDLVAEWEAENGPITEAEAAAARAELGLGDGGASSRKRKSA